LIINKNYFSVVKGVNSEVSKGFLINNNFAKSTESAASATSNMSEAAKSLGNNLSGATIGLLKVQSTLGTKNIGDYQDAIHILAFAILNT